jgi:hypothetical protein
MIDLLKLEANEAEKIAYAEGFTMAAELFARIAELEAERDELAGKLEEAQDQIPDAKQYAQDQDDLMHLKAFFYDCFNRLPGVYPCPEYSSEYDKSVIFDAIEKGGAL